MRRPFLAVIEDVVALRDRLNNRADRDLLADACDIMSRAAAAPVEINAPSPWRPIQTAPKDGRSVIAWVPGFGMGAFTLFWSDEGWREPAHMNRLKVEPTYWMAIPDPPKPTVSESPVGSDPTVCPQILSSNAQSVRPDGGEG